MHEIEVRTKNKPDDSTGMSGGLGDPATVEVETLPGGSFEPTKAAIAVLTDTSVQVTWSPPEGLFGTVAAYYVVVKQAGSEVRRERVSAPETSLVLTGLGAGVKYDFYVQAQIAPNSQGLGGGLGPEVLVTETSQS
ncbi:unnamed protein product [Dibothriocephalus latus]|uniref:Fibronectin type-III domain-containing protein n=1 Tax=Dibothriocephalus latus TaxID=60516 RepID=A0A3P6RQW3_DIBLA|nr:unnamed protein product [Dibothriocephalus latus]